MFCHSKFGIHYGLPVVDDALVAVVLDCGLVVDVDDVVVDGGRGDPEEDQLLVKVAGRVQLGQGPCETDVTL